MADQWLAARTAAFESSGIRRVFDLAADLENPINLSIGQPDFDVPDSIQRAAQSAMDDGRNGYSQTQGIAPLKDALTERYVAPLGHKDRRLVVTSGTSGALVTAIMAVVDPGDEVIIFDPYFVSYPALVRMVGGVPVFVDTYPSLQINLEQLAAAITDKTKLILFNSPANPTGVVTPRAIVKELAQLCQSRGILLLSDEIYRTFCYEAECPSPAEYNEQTLVVDGFSKTYGMTGWRVGFVHGPEAIIEKMAMIQQYTYVCAPHPFQWAGVAALEVDMSAHVAEFARRRDKLIDALGDQFQMTPSGGAFYLFPQVPEGSATEFVEKAIENELLIIPGSVFSRRDTHFRISYAASDATLERGIEVLCTLLK